MQTLNEILTLKCQWHENQDVTKSFKKSQNHEVAKLSCNKIEREIFSDL